nr:sensor histidine kinase [uncultured Acetatifactor sp.]
MKFTDYCKDKLLLLMLHAFCMLLLAAFLIATAYPVVNCCIILFSWFLILAVWFLTEYFRRKRYFAQIGIILEQADTKFLLGELMPRSFRLEDSFYRDFIRRSNKSVIEKIRAVEDSRQEYREYIESWVHEIKAPIADICLLCEKQKDETARRILEQNRRTENYVDMALFYARSDEVYKDYLIREACLQETAEEVLQKNKYAFIQSKVQARVSCPDRVYTDVKWIAFILNQLVLNAVKYRRDANPRIRIATLQGEHGVCLHVEDNGMGIPVEELPRIFEKGFTGSNGRTRGRSTGMGLYLCRKLCRKLGIGIRAESQESAGTRIILEFPVSNYLSGFSCREDSHNA